MRLYTTPTGETRVTCGGHRTLGLYFHEGRSLCRCCHLPAEQHESTDETVARKALEA